MLFEGFHMPLAPKYFFHILAQGPKISTNMLLEWEVQWTWSKKACVPFYRCHLIAV